METRNTIQRQLVLEAVQALHNHPTAEEIYARVAQKHPAISRGTVYRNLGVLAGQGQVRRVPGGSADRFDFNLAPHGHFHCRGCGAVYDAELPWEGAAFSEGESPQGFLYEECVVTFSGLCPECNK